MSSLDRIKKKREQLLVENNKSYSSTDKSMQRISSLRNELSTTGKIDYGDIAPINLDNLYSSEWRNKVYANSERTSLLAKQKELQEKLKNYDRKENPDRQWWEDDKNVFENLISLPRKAISPEFSKSKYLEDPEYDKLVKEYDAVNKAVEDNYAATKKYDDGIMGYIEKAADVFTGNASSGFKGVESTAKKILGTAFNKEVETDTDLTLQEKISQRVMSESQGVEKASYEVVGSIGRMLPQFMSGDPGIATAIGFANFGGGAYNQAKREGYSEEEATKYGLAIGSLEMATSKALGTFSSIYGKSKMGNASQEVIDKVIPRIIKNKQVRNVLGQFAAEGSEEFLQEYIEGIARDTLLDDKGFLKSTWENISDPDKFADALYSGLIGGITGSTMAIPSQIDAYRYEKATGRDAETGLTANEQKVVDSEVAKRTDGKNLTKKQIAEIETEVKNELEKGYISTDTIESVLGGDTYNNLKSTRDNKTKIENEIKALEGKKNAEITVKEMEHLKDLREQLKGIDTNTLETDLQGKMGQIIKSDGYLQRSYQEKAKRGQKFTYDASKVTNEFEKAALESASKVMNDTNRSHEFVEPVVKLAKDKGTYYEFTNNAELEKSNYDVKGKQVNGLVTVEENGKKKILINVDSAKALNTIVGHETTHLLEGTQEYQELQDAIFNYAKTKGDFDSRQASLYSLYKDIKGADVNSELTADLVGDYLFTDNNFISELSTQKPTVFQKIKELIDDLVVRFKGTKEEKALREVQKKFKEAYRQSSTQTNTDTKYSMIGEKGASNVVNANLKNQFVLTNLETAKSMAKEGKSNAEIFETTGWFKQYGKWKFEISDAIIDGVTINNVEKNHEYLLSDILNHKDLFIAYKDFKNTKVSFIDIKDYKGKMVGGQYDTKTKTIELNNKLLDKKNPDKAVKRVLMHEIQHKIQQYEGFKSGSTGLLGETLYNSSKGEVEARETEKRLEMSYKQRRNELPNAVNSRMDSIPELVYNGFGKEKSVYESDSDIDIDSIVDIDGNFMDKTTNEILERSISDRRGTRGKVQELDNSSFFNAEYSLGENTLPRNPNLIYGEDVKLQVEETIAPLQEEIQTLTETVQELKEQIAPIQSERLDTALNTKKGDEYAPLTEEDLPYLEQQYNEAPKEDIAPPEIEENTPVAEDEITPTKSLFETRNYEEVGSRKVNAYQYDNPEVKPYFQEAARSMIDDLANSLKGQRIYNDQLYYDSNGEQGYFGITRTTTNDIAELLDGVDGKYKLSYKDLEKGLKAIIEDHGAENNAASKRIEFYLDKRLREGFTTLDGVEIPANQEYLKLLEAIETTDYHNSIPIGEAPVENVDVPTSDISNTKASEEIAPIKEQEVSNTKASEDIAPTMEQIKENNVAKEKPSQVEQQVAKILDERPTPKNKDKKLKAIATVNILDKGYYISKLARQTDNRQLDALWDNTLLSNAQAQEVIGEGRFKFNEETKSYEKVGDSVYEIFEGLETTDKVKEFNNYMYHKLNIERMSLEDKAQVRMKELLQTTLKSYTNEDIKEISKTNLKEDAKQEIADVVNAAKEYENLKKVKNKPVFGYTVDADHSIQVVNAIEQNNPEFSDYAKKVYNYESGTYSDLSLLVESGILSQEDANYYRDKYESYVPIMRDMEVETMENQIFGKKIGIGKAVKSATGGNQNIIPLKDAMAIKTMLVQRSANMNKLGLELMYALNPVVESETVSAENVIEDISNNKDLIQAGTNGKAPTMTVYEHGVKKTFEIPQEIYAALKTNYDSNLRITVKPLNAYSNFKRGVLTQYNPFFMVTNMIKDAQDVLINSQHPATTYKAIPEAIAQLKSKGYWYKEMQSQGLFQDTYYDNQGGFDTTKKGVEKIGEFYPLKKISEINDFIERVPRMAEYIASRKAGRSVEVASLDASRVTTNFKAGGELTKAFNRNGFTFLNASVQGALQQVRNVQEAHQKGLKGYMALATKFTVAALPAILLNNLIWDDDDEYEELSEYIKDNYYIIGKYGDGQFIRIPKGRMTAVIQKGLQEMTELATGDDEADLNSFLELVLTNLAPSNPLENNIAAPFVNTKLLNKDDPGTTWYGEDLVPTRLQSKPAKEQYDETTDEFSKWLGDKLNLSPIKINNLIDQNTGVIGDLLLPMMTAEAKTKNDNPIFAAIEDKFTADVVFDNKYSTDFYSVKEDLAKKSNSYEATDEDTLKTKYMNSKQAEMNKIYAEIRDVQNSDLDKETKYAQVRDLREQLNEIAETSIKGYNKINIGSNYAKVGEIEFRKNADGEWQKITDKQLEKQNEATNNVGISASDYWDNKEEYDYAVDNPDKYRVIEQIDTFDNYNSYKDDIADIKEQFSEGNGYSTKDRKAAVQQYINSLSLDIPQKIMLEKMAGGYSIKDYENYMFSYIQSLPMTAEEKQAMHKQLFD